MQADQKLLDELVRRIVSAVHPLRIILFGSAVRGEMCPNSDFDVLVVMPDGVQRRKTAQYIYSQMLDFGFAKDIAVATKSDLKNYKNNPGLIYKQALSEGKELYHAPIVNQYPVRDKPTFFQSLLCPGNA